MHRESSWSKKGEIVPFRLTRRCRADDTNDKQRTKKKKFWRGGVGKVRRGALIVSGWTDERGNVSWAECEGVKGKLAVPKE